MSSGNTLICSTLSICSVAVRQFFEWVEFPSMPDLDTPRPAWMVVISPIRSEISSASFPLTLAGKMK